MRVDWSWADPVEWPDNEFGQSFGFLPLPNDVPRWEAMRSWWVENPPEYRRHETPEGVKYAIHRTKQIAQAPRHYNGPISAKGKVLHDRFTKEQAPEE